MAKMGQARVVVVSWLAILALVGLYLGWVALSRMEPRRAKSALPPLPPGVDFGSDLRITQFYPSALEIVEGQQALICYGVANARSVRLDPPGEQLRPMFNKCIPVEPVATTTYRLTAEGDNGAKATQSLTIKVSPAPPTILFVDLSSDELRRGEPWIMCYGVRKATTVKLQPLGLSLPPSPKHCARLLAVRTMKYTRAKTGAAIKSNSPYG